MTNILLITRGSGGDVFPYIQIGKELTRRGHVVTIFTHCYYESLVRQAKLGFEALETSDEFAEMIADQHLLVNPNDTITFYRKHILSRAIAEYEVIRSRHQAQNAFIVFNHNSHLVVQLAIEKLHLSHCSILMAPNNPLMNPELFQEQLKFLANDINQLRARIDLLPIHQWDIWLGAVRKSLALWPEWFAAPNPECLTEVEPIGFVLNDLDSGTDLPEEIQNIIKHGEPPILITFGTNPAKSGFFSACIEACRLLKRQVILVTLHNDLDLNHLPSHIVKTKYVPFKLLMPHMAAVIHQGGIGTSGHALASGIPQVLLVKGIDGPDTAIRLQKLGVAEFFPFSHWQPKKIAEALSRLMSSSEARMRCKHLAQELRNTDSVTTACNRIENLILEGESHNLVLQAKYKDALIDARKRPQVDKCDFLNDIHSMTPAKRALLASRLRKME